MRIWSGCAELLGWTEGLQEIGWFNSLVIFTPNEWDLLRNVLQMRKTVHPILNRGNDVWKTKALFGTWE